MCESQEKPTDLQQASLRTPLSTAYPILPACLRNQAAVQRVSLNRPILPLNTRAGAIHLDRRLVVPTNIVVQMFALTHNSTQVAHRQAEEEKILLCELERLRGEMIDRGAILVRERVPILRERLLGRLNDVHDIELVVREMVVVFVSVLVCAPDTPLARVDFLRVCTRVRRHGSFGHTCFPAHEDVRNAVDASCHSFESFAGLAGAFAPGFVR